VQQWTDTAWTPPDDTRYARAVGQIRVLERELLTARRLRGVAEAHDLEQALHDLEDTIYGPTLSGLAHPEDFEDALEEELRRTYELFAELCLEPEVDTWLRMRHDAANIKALLKGGTVVPLSSVGRVPAEELRGSMEVAEYRDLPAAVADLAEDAARVAENDGLLAMELFLDREVLALQTALVATRRKTYLSDLTRVRIDLANLAVVARVTRLGRSRAQASNYLAMGGSFDRGFWLKLCGMPLEEIQEAFFMTEYQSLATQGLDQLGETGSFATLEKLSEEHLMGRLRDAKTFVFGVEPLVAFVLAKEHEMAMVRMILVGKQNEIPSDQLVDRISMCYV
jgi:V/A-type H+-transporting ATPase subunit C